MREFRQTAVNEARLHLLTSPRNPRVCNLFPNSKHTPLLTHTNSYNQPEICILASTTPVHPSSHHCISMGASPRDVQHSLEPRARMEASAGHAHFSSAPTMLPAELLLEFARNTEDVEDLQRLRLVSRAFSHAATTALQERFTQIYILPLQSSMARFTRLTVNPLIEPKIRYAWSM